MENFNLILILLVCSVIFLIICRKLYLPPVIGYLSVGFIIGPGGLGWFKSLEELHFLGELGIVFLMFTLGLEFSINQLLNSKKALIGIGGTQVLLCGAAITLIAYLANLHFKQAIIIGSALALSSTAVVLKQLQEQKEQQTPHGKLSIKILLFQDIAAVLLLIIIPALGSKQGLSITNFLITLTKGAGVFLVMGLVGSKLIKPLF
ncbi:MAG: cation:proton antiporter, partial [Gammaproteobacteria bacterium]